MEYTNHSSAALLTLTRKPLQRHWLQRECSCSVGTTTERLWRELIEWGPGARRPVRSRDFKRLRVASDLLLSTRTKQSRKAVRINCINFQHFLWHRLRKGIQLLVGRERERNITSTYQKDESLVFTSDASNLWKLRSVFISVPSVNAN